MARTIQRRTALAGLMTLTIGLSLAAVAALLQSEESSRDVDVFAAASLRDVVDDVVAAYKREHTEAGRVFVNAAGSNVLAQQILASSQADVFLSANEQWMDRVELAGRLADGTRRPILSNRLVVIANAASDLLAADAHDLADLPFAHLAIADPEAVPAGQYAKRFLENTPHDGTTLWAAMAPRLAPTLDVRAALALAESDPSVIAIVYRTDAAASQRVRVLFEVPTETVPPIRYFAARVKPSQPSSSAASFFDFLFSGTAREIFLRHGFLVDPADPSAT